MYTLGIINCTSTNTIHNTGRMNKNRNPIDGANMHKSDILFVKIHKSEIPIHKLTAYI